MERERRRAVRRRADLFVNKFIDGTPYAARLVEISPLGCLLERVLEPEVQRDLYPLELSLPAGFGGARMWLWARPVWGDAARTAFKFVGVDPLDRATLTRFAASLRAT
jgi:hypothetical protein